MVRGRAALFRPSRFSACRLVSRTSGRITTQFLAASGTIGPSRLLRTSRTAVLRREERNLRPCIRERRTGSSCLHRPTEASRCRTVEPDTQNATRRRNDNPDRVSDRAEQLQSAGRIAYLAEAIKEAPRVGLVKFFTRYAILAKRRTSYCRARAARDVA